MSPQFLEQSSNIPGIAARLFIQPAIFGGSKGISSKQKSLKRVLQRSLRETHSDGRKGKFKMPQGLQAWKNTLDCQGKRRSCLMIPNTVLG